MDITIDGVPFHRWKYTLPEWWLIRHPENHLPTDGSARLRSGTRKQVGLLAATGQLATNMVGATSRDYVACDLPIYGLCLAFEPR